MRVRILNSNTHAGQGLRDRGLVTCADQLDVDIITVQEVQRPSARMRMRSQFPSRVWGIHGLRPPSLGAGAAGNHVLWNKDIWHKVAGRRDLISPQLWDNGKRDKWHPSRRHGQVRLVANGMEEVRLTVQSDHTWTTMGHPWDNPDRVVVGHKRQCREYAEAAWEAHAHGYKVVACGDYNDAVAPADDHEAFIELMMETHGMVQARNKNAARPALDAAFTSKDVVVVSFDWIPKHLLTSDHEGFLLVVDI